MENYKGSDSASAAWTAEFGAVEGFSLTSSHVG